MTVALPSTGPSAVGVTANDVEAISAVRRSAAWEIVAAGVAAGCPVPQDVYIDGRGAGVSVTVDHLHDLAAWITHLHAPAATAREFLGEDGRWQRTHLVEHIVGMILVDVQHHDRLPAPAPVWSR